MEKRARRRAATRFDGSSILKALALVLIGIVVVTLWILFLWVASV